MNPAVSVVMSVFNGEAYLPDALESILDQTWSDFEFLIIDDGSTDNAADILCRYASHDSRVRVVRRENTGLTRALNEGISMARGEFVARMDADDIADTRRLEHQVRYLRTHTNCAAVGCGLLLIDSDGDVLEHQQVPETHEAILTSLFRGIGALPHPSAVIRRDKLLAVNGYRESFACAQDLDLWLRLSEIGELANLPEPLLRYRLHCQSVTLQRRELQLACAEQAVRDAYQRRKQAVPEELHLAIPGTPSAEKTFRSWARMALRSGNVQVARKHAKNAFRAAPFSLKNLGIAAKLLTPRFKRAG